MAPIKRDWHYNQHSQTNPSVTIQHNSHVTQAKMTTSTTIVTTTGQAKTSLPIVLGCMTLGAPDHPQTRIHTPEDEAAFLSTFASHGHTMLDTSIMYGGGTSEARLGFHGVGGSGRSGPNSSFRVATKIYPTRGRVPPPMPQYSLTESSIRETLATSLASLGTESVDLYYFHAPDVETPVVESLRVVDQLVREGKVGRFGISNYTAEQVREMCEVCRREGLVKPVVYQGLYNAVHRVVEKELLPVLREEGIAFYAFNPLAGGFLAGRFKRGDVVDGEGGRFDAKTQQGKAYVDRYWNDEMFEAVEIVRRAVVKDADGKEGGLGMAECALRWMMWHGELRREMGDAVIIGASSAEQLEGNLRAFEKGRLPEGVVKAFDEGWEVVKGRNTVYWH